MAREGEGDGDALALASRELVRVGVGYAICVCQVYFGEGGTDGFTQLFTFFYALVVADWPG